MKKLLIPIIIIMLVVPVLLLIKKDKKIENNSIKENNETSILNNINQFKVGNDEFILEKGEILSFDYSTFNYYFYNQERYEGTPYLYKNISISSTYLEVIEAFNIKKDYAALNVEEINADGLNNIINIPYTNDSFIDKNYKDVNLVFGYKLVDGNWNMIPYNKLNTYIGNSDIEDDIIIYMIDLVEENGLIEKYHVSGISVEYYG